MACKGCQERQRLLRQAAQAVKTNQPLRPIARQFGQTVVNDANRIVRAINPRLIGPRPR